MMLLSNSDEDETLSECDKSEWVSPFEWTSEMY